MPTPYESARLNLQLFEMRREPVLREARMWFTLEFNPDSFAELLSVAGGEREASIRMVLGYWEMAASLVTHGAIDSQAFLDAHGEIFLTFSKISPWLAEIRATIGEPELCKHMERLVMSVPDAESVLTRRRTATRAAAAARRAGQ